MLLAGGASLWQLGHPAIGYLLVPGATNLQVHSSGFRAQRITYDAPGPAYGWYFQVLRNLARDRWQAPVDTRTRIRNRPDIHWRLRQIGPIYIEEQIALQREPNHAQIELRRRIIVPWRRWLGS